MNEQTQFFMYLSHFILDVSVVCERYELRQGQTAILTQLLLLTIAASWLRLLNRGSLRATALILQAGPHSSLPISN